MIDIYGDRKDTGIWADIEKEIWMDLEKFSSFLVILCGDLVQTKLFEVFAKILTKIFFWVFINIVFELKYLVKNAFKCQNGGNKLFILLYQSFFKDLWIFKTLSSPAFQLFANFVKFYPIRFFF